MTTTQTVMIDPTLFRAFLQRFAAALCRVRPRHTGTAGGLFHTPPGGPLSRPSGLDTRAAPFFEPHTPVRPKPVRPHHSKDSGADLIPTPLQGRGRGGGGRGGRGVFHKAAWPLVK